MAGGWACSPVKCIGSDGAGMVAGPFGLEGTQEGGGERLGVLFAAVY
jgi:hypothetical protein